MGRPTKLTKDIQEQLVKIIEQGNYRTVACKAVGLHPNTFRKWMNADGQPYMSFRAAIERAEARCEVEVVSLLREQIAGNYRAGLEFLGRKFPQRWASKAFSGDLDENGQPASRPIQSAVLVVPAEIDDIHEWSRKLPPLSDR